MKELSKTKEKSFNEILDDYARIMKLIDDYHKENKIHFEKEEAKKKAKKLI